MNDLFTSPTGDPYPPGAGPLSGAISKAAVAAPLDPVPGPDGLSAGVVLVDGEATAEARAKKSWTSGWSVSGAVSYAKKQGLAAAAFVGWTPKVLLALMLAGATLSAEDRVYHVISVAKVPQTKWTHAEVTGRVTLVKHEADGDIHIRLTALDGSGKFIVLEIIPGYAALWTAPKVGDTIVARGIVRQDKVHRWYELHPLESWRFR